MKRLTDILTNFLLIISITVLLGILLAPPLFNVTFHVIVGSSMEPTIKLGSVVGLAEISPANVQKGDIIAFTVDQMDIPVTHRVLERIEENGVYRFRTQGDNVEDPDPWVVEPGNILGKVVFAIPYVGRLTQLIKDPLGFIVIIGFPATAVVLFQVYELFFKKPQRRNRRQLQSSSEDRTEAYLFLFIGLASVIFLWHITSRNIQPKALRELPNFEFVEEEGLYRAERQLTNNGDLPLILTLTSNDPGVTFSETHFRLPPNGQKTVQITAPSATAMIIAAGYFPLLPEEVLYRLFLWNPEMAPLVAVALPILPFVLLGFVLLGGLSPRRKRRYRLHQQRRRPRLSS